MDRFYTALEIVLQHLLMSNMAWQTASLKSCLDVKKQEGIEMMTDVFLQANEFRGVTSNEDEVRRHSEDIFSILIIRDWQSHMDEWHDAALTGFQPNQLLDSISPPKVKVFIYILSKFI
jgi:hypothetical protein